MAHPATRRAVAADVGKTLLVVPIRSAERHLLDRLVHDQTLQNTCDISRSFWRGDGQTTRIRSTNRLLRTVHSKGFLNFIPVEMARSCVKSLRRLLSAHICSVRVYCMLTTVEALVWLSEKLAHCACEIRTKNNLNEANECLLQFFSGFLAQCSEHAMFMSIFSLCWRAALSNTAFICAPNGPIMPKNIRDANIYSVCNVYEGT